ncbi:hypothetical protein B481_2028 [Planococcus halocryophilus Or1]|uniref:Uncharacterized protein n=2 Tax=Planococcus halocryophilus TaxID=1215089 RepID=A0A1C7DQF2_9BACL|nr:hypothetical protein BBI08_06395 [Planococcus halocryophilus]EMF46301.1 hypothetical protein B481_2028 [Planococcus halocryophilus Or1]
MVKKVEDLQEYRDAKDLEVRMHGLPSEAQTVIIQNIINQTCWHGPVTREWMENEIASQELLDNESLKLVTDHPVEDHFGSEIHVGDKWFEDGAGRVVLEDNVEDYLIEVANVEFCRAIE